MKKHNKIFLSLMLLIGFVFAMPASVSAQDSKEPDLSKKGVLGIVLESERDKSPISNADVTLYRVADAKVRNEKIVYDCVPDFAGYAKTLEDVKSPDTAKKLFVYAAQHRISGETKYTDKTGRTQFNNLRAGVYLISQIKGNDNYESFLPFLAVLPYDNNGKWEFNLIARPKFSEAYSDEKLYISVKKVWNDDGKNRPKSITAELICDGKVYEAVELSDENGWKHEWQNLDEQKKWSVREQQVPKDYVVTYSKDGNNYTIYNTRTLIQTGQLKWPIPVLASGGMVLIVTGLVLRSKKKKDE